MFRRSHPAPRLSATELKKLEFLFRMVDDCTFHPRRDQDTPSRLADAINGYPNPTMVHEVMRRIRKCFTAKNPQVVLRALDLTEILMQSCERYAPREVASDKFLKPIGKLCKLTKTGLDPSWQTVSERAQELVAGWAEASPRMVATATIAVRPTPGRWHNKDDEVGFGKKFIRLYETLKRDRVPFRGGSGGHATSAVARDGGVGGRFRTTAGSALPPGDEGYDEELDLASKIFDSTLSTTKVAALAGGDRSGGAGGLAAASGDGGMLSDVPPTIEALMDIMEGSKDLAELLDSDVVVDVVDQARSLVERAIEKVEELNAAGHADDMDPYLKAHDDLQTVLRVYDAVLDGDESLPLSRGAAGAIAAKGKGNTDGADNNTKTSPSGSELTDAHQLRELDRLVSMAMTLGEMASRHTEDKNLKQKELALPPGSKAYFTLVKTGLSNAYLAASVVSSGLVCTSNTGSMGKAGEALKLLSGVVPGVSGLGAFAAAALKAGDRHIQTRRVVKMAEMASDALECCALARKLGLRLTDGLANGTISTTEHAGKIFQLTTVANADGAGFALPDSESEEAVMEWFTGEVADLEADNTVGRETSAEQAGRRLGKQHLRTLLMAVGRGCLEGTNNAEEKVERLLKVVVPEGRTRAVIPPRSPVTSSVRSPASAPLHDGNLDRDAEFAYMKAKMKALELAEERRRAELESLKSSHERVQGQMDALRKNFPKRRGEASSAVDAGGQELLAQEQKTKTKEEFVAEMQNPGLSTHQQSVTPDELRVIHTYVEELSRETGYLGARVAALEEGNEGRRKGRKAPLRRCS
eukprot:g2479.t1